MTNRICLDENFSTTRQATTEKPKIANSSEDKFETILFLPISEWRKGEGGLRTKDYYKKSWDGRPLISIITVVFNGEKYLEDTIQSVMTQTYDNVEYIIIDGGSTDGTLDIIKKYEDKIDYWVSEKDKGIYDAMNKGIDVSTGEWINFMNAGDEFYNESVINDIFKQNLQTECDILYGDTSFKYPSFMKIVKANTKLHNLWKGMQFTHQSTFIKTKLHKQNKFKLDKKIGADFEFFYKCYANKAKFKYIDKTISIMELGGISYTDRISSVKDHYNVVLESNKSIYVKIYYQYIILLNHFKIIVKKILPKQIICFLQR